MDPGERGRARSMTAVYGRVAGRRKRIISHCSSIILPSAQPLPGQRTKAFSSQVSMEYEDDYSLAVPLIFTVLAVIVATVLIKLRSGGEKQQAEAHQEEEKAKVTEHIEEEEIKKEEKGDVNEGGVGRQTEEIPVEEVGASEELPQESVQDNEKEVEEFAVQERRASNHSSQEEEDSKDEDFEVESDKILKISEADDADDEDFSFKYCPGKLRGSDYEKMLTKDELEEEQRTEDVEKLSS